MNEEVNVIKNFSAENNEAEIIKDSLVKITKFAMYNDSKYGKMADKTFSSISVDNYDKEAQDAKMALLAFCANKSGIKSIQTKADVINAFENPSFRTIFNSIIVDVLQSIVLRSRPEQIWRLANVDDVDVGDSQTYEIETKGLPIAQRTSYTTNVTFLDSYSRMSITVTPKPYSIGTTMDYIRILANNYDMGRELARVAFALLYAQLRLIVDEIYSVTPITGTPFYQATWDAGNYVQMIEDIKMLNGGSDVTAYGTIPAFNKMGVLATTNYGFQSQDEMIREGFLGRAYGVDNVVIDQFTDLSQPFTNTTAPTLRAIPNDRIILLSSVADKPVKLVREDFVHVKVKEPTDGSQYRYNYEYFMSFDAAIVTQANYGIQSVGE